LFQSEVLFTKSKRSILLKQRLYSFIIFSALFLSFSPYLSANFSSEVSKPKPTRQQAWVDGSASLCPYVSQPLPTYQPAFVQNLRYT